MDRHMVVMDEARARELRLLKEAWDLPSIDAVVDRLLQAHRSEKIKALGLEVRLPHGQPE